MKTSVARLLVLPGSGGGSKGRKPAGVGAAPPGLAGVTFSRGYLFTFRIGLRVEKAIEESHRFVVTADGDVKAPPRWEDLFSIPRDTLPVEPARTRRAAVEAAYAVAREELTRRAAVILSDCLAAAAAKVEEERLRLDEYYQTLSVEALRPIRRVLHQLAVSTTYLQLTRSAGTAAMYAEEVDTLTQRVAVFLESQREASTGLADEYAIRTAELAGRYTLPVEVELLALAEVYRPACSGCRAPGCRSCDVMARLRSAWGQ